MGDIHHPKQNAGSAWEKVAPFIPTCPQGLVRVPAVLWLQQPYTAG